MTAPDELREAVAAAVLATRDASRVIAAVDGARRTAALACVARRIAAAGDDILEANRQDVDDAKRRDIGKTKLARLEMRPERLAWIDRLFRDVAEQPDVIGRLEREHVGPGGLEVARMRIPLGVLAMIYESRPHVTACAAACSLRSGNAAVLRGGSEAARTNQAFAAAIARGLEDAELPAATVQVLPWTDRRAVAYLLEHEEAIDVVIPRGSAELVRYVCETSRIPVLKHAHGVCHVYVHAAADIDRALDICFDAKAIRPFTCHTAETFLVDRAIAPAFLPRLRDRLRSVVELRGDALTRELCGADAVIAATDEDWATEYLDFIVSIRVVDGIAEAIEHIRRYGSSHTDAIVSEDAAAADRFVRSVHSSMVLVNASTRLAELPALGLGPELGTSTSKLHAFGPMGAEELTTTKFVVRGAGHVRG